MKLNINQNQYSAYSVFCSLRAIFLGFRFTHLPKKRVSTSDLFSQSKPGLLHLHLNIPSQRLSSSSVVQKPGFRGARMWQTQNCLSLHVSPRPHAIFPTLEKRFKWNQKNARFNMEQNTTYINFNGYQYCMKILI